MTRAASDFYTCLSCGNRRSADEMRYPGKTKGVPRMVCRSCCLDRPGQAWCNGHRTFHPRSDFHGNKKRPEGVTESCKTILTIHQYNYRHGHQSNIRLRTCMICNVDKHPSLFHGGINKRYICSDCSEGHPGKSWCVGCKAWDPLEWFEISSRRNPMSWCALCWALRTHGTTLQNVLDTQKISTPQCAVCDNPDRRKLCVDHDHRCCPGERSCGKCVRGLLCGRCNRIEALLETTVKADRMASYMHESDRRWAVMR